MSELRCAHDGMLVNGVLDVPDDPSEAYVEGLPIIGCSNLLCPACREGVRQRVEGKARKYWCGCDSWTETTHHELDDRDTTPGVDPTVPWRCGGHPRKDEPFERFEPDWVRMVRVFVKAHEPLAQRVAHAAREALGDRALRRDAIEFARITRTGLDSVAKLLDEAIEAETEGAVWRALGGHDRERLRAALVQRDRGTRDLFDAGASGDASWFVEHVEDIARATPAKKEELLASLAQLPAGADRDARARIRAAVPEQGSRSEVIAAFVARVKKAPKTGVAARLRLELPRERDETIEWEFRGEYPNVRFVDVVTTRGGEKSREPWLKGTHAEVVAALEAAGAQ